jgi:hypothetical protein
MEYRDRLVFLYRLMAIQQGDMLVLSESNINSFMPALWEAIRLMGYDMSKPYGDGNGYILGKDGDDGKEDRSTTRSASE